MTDQENKKVLSLGGKPKLELKKSVSSDSASGGSVKQSHAMDSARASPTGTCVLASL